MAYVAVLDADVLHPHMAELPPLGEADVAQAATIAAIAIMQKGRRTLRLDVLTLFDLVAVCLADSILS